MDGSAALLQLQPPLALSLSRRSLSSGAHAHSHTRLSPAASSMEGLVYGPISLFAHAHKQVACVFFSPVTHPPTSLSFTHTS